VLKKILKIILITIIVLICIIILCRAFGKSNKKATTLQSNPVVNVRSREKIKLTDETQSTETTEEVKEENEPVQEENVEEYSEDVPIKQEKSYTERNASANVSPGVVTEGPPSSNGSQVPSQRATRNARKTFMVFRLCALRSSPESSRSVLCSV